jgi:hypothetical protein
MTILFTHHDGSLNPTYNKSYQSPPSTTPSSQVQVYTQQPKSNKETECTMRQKTEDAKRVPAN